MLIGIVGAEAAKFTPDGEQAAKKIIRGLLNPGDIVVSGGCHLGGIDIWAEEIAKELGLRTEIFRPAKLCWTYYKERNIRIAGVSQELYCITVNRLPETYKGMRFPSCYHCNTTEHIKSGGCWTTKYAREKLGKNPHTIVVWQ